MDPPSYDDVVHNRHNYRRDLEAFLVSARASHLQIAAGLGPESPSVPASIAASPALFPRDRIVWHIYTTRRTTSFFSSESTYSFVLADTNHPDQAPSLSPSSSSSASSFSPSPPQKDIIWSASMNTTFSLTSSTHTTFSPKQAQYQFYRVQNFDTREAYPVDQPLLICTCRFFRHATILSPKHLVELRYAHHPGSNQLWNPQSAPWSSHANLLDGKSLQWKYDDCTDDDEHENESRRDGDQADHRDKLVQNESKREKEKKKKRDKIHGGEKRSKMVFVCSTVDRVAGRQLEICRVLDHGPPKTPGEIRATVELPAWLFAHLTTRRPLDEIMGQVLIHVIRRENGWINR